MAELIGRLQPNFGSRVRASPPPPKILPSKKKSSRRNHHPPSSGQKWNVTFQTSGGKIITSKSSRHVKFKSVAGKIQKSSYVDIIAPKSVKNSNNWRENPNPESSSRRASHTLRKIGEERERRRTSITRPTNWDLNSPCFTRGEAAQLAIHRHQQRDDHKQ